MSSICFELEVFKTNIFCVGTPSGLQNSHDCSQIATKFFSDMHQGIISNLPSKIIHLKISAFWRSRGVVFGQAKCCIKIQQISFQKMDLKLSSVECMPSCPASMFIYICKCDWLKLCIHTVLFQSPHFLQYHKWYLIIKRLLILQLSSLLCSLANQITSRMKYTYEYFAWKATK